MTKLSAADRSQIYTELTEATSAETAEVLMQSIVDTPWGNLVTKDHLDAQLAKFDSRFASLEGRIDARFAQHDAKFERAIRKQIVWTISAMFTFNALLAAWITAFH